MKENRTQKSIKNASFALLEQGAVSLMSFICRTVFIYTLGKTYLGFSGLFSDIFSLLSLAELGIGTAIIYSMYKPMAENDYRLVSALLNLYKRFYLIIGGIITATGLCLTPFLSFFITDIPKIPELPVIYVLYLLNTTSSYFFIYKKSVLITDQKNYIASLIYIAVTIIQNIMQIVFLLTTRNFIIYLIIQVVATYCNNIAVSVYVNKYYTELKQYKHERIDAELKKSIYNNVRAMFLSKVSSAIVTSTDNLLISKFVSTVILGMYSNYTLFTSLLRTIFTKIFEGITGGMGNLIALESSENIYKAFRKIWFINFWLVSFCSVCLYTLINPFIELWIGRDYLLESQVVFIICLNFYMRFIRNTFLMMTDTFGLFQEMKIKCIAEAIINLVASLLLVKVFSLGIYGVLLGTFISNIMTNFWYEPYVIFKVKFNMPMRRYFVEIGKYFVATALSMIIMKIIWIKISIFGGWFSFCIGLLLCVIVINTLYALLFYKTEEYSFLKHIIMIRLLKK